MIASNLILEMERYTMLLPLATNHCDFETAGFVKIAGDLKDLHMAPHAYAHQVPVICYSPGIHNEGIFF